MLVCDAGKWSAVRGRISKMFAKTGCFTGNEHVRLVRIASAGGRLLKPELENVMNGSMM